MRKVKTATALVIVVLLLFAGCAKKENPPPKVDLHTATITGNLEAVEQHIKAGTDLNEKDMYGSTPLIIAATLGKNDVALALIEAGADLNIPNNDGSTPLITAAFLCRTEIVRALLDKGADKTIKNKAGRTALDAVSRPFEDVKAIYDSLGESLGPLGLDLDYTYIKTTRPKIAEMLE